MKPDEPVPPGAASDAINSMMTHVNELIAPTLDHAIAYREELESAGYSRENAERVSSEMHAGMVKILMNQLATTVAASFKGL